ncbi:MAG: uroporphyrinogen-III C-methyltransferase [Deltaproteobacteria bacterium]|jgi:uroporphyrinogen III methyltransferase/synthase|nr:uroporphyrinogen-III C-methyltransferase [Deltaproteobacteria bacterium]
MSVPEPEKAAGKVYLIGAGPGDPGLITLKGAELIKKAQVIVHDYLASPELLRLAPPGCRLIDAGKKAGRHILNQKAINELLVSEGRKGNTVVRLKGGDPYIFGRGGEEAVALFEAGVAFEVVPGVSSAVAAAASAGIPLTHRGISSQVTILTGHSQTDSQSLSEWENLLPGQTLSVVMGHQNLYNICQKLIGRGFSPQTQAAAVQWGTTPKQKTLTGTLATLPDKVAANHLTPPVLLVVGAVVGLRDRLNWFEKRPLFGKSVLVTRTTAQSGRLAEPLRDLGAQVWERPVIKIAPILPNPELNACLNDISQFQYLILTSPNGAEIFLKYLMSRAFDVRCLGGLKIVTIGPGTARTLESFGLKADLTPELFQAEGLIELFKTQPAGAVLLARAERAREILPAGLSDLGFQVTLVCLYRTVAETADSAPLPKVDLVTLTSASTARGLAALLDPSERSGYPAVSIGPITTQAAKEEGLKVVAESPAATIDSLVKTAALYLSGKDIQNNGH